MNEDFLSKSEGERRGESERKGKRERARGRRREGKRWPVAGEPCAGLLLSLILTCFVCFFRNYGWPCSEQRRKGR